MPRPSKFEVLKNATFNKLNNLQSKLDYRSFRAYQKKIIDTNRRDTLQKLNDELTNFRDYLGETTNKYTQPKIKSIVSLFNGLKSKMSNLSAVKNIRFDLDGARQLLSTKQIVKNILDIYNRNAGSNQNYRILLNVGGVSYTLTPANQKRLLRFANNNFVTYEETTESDGAVVAQLINNPILNIDYVEPVSKYEYGGNGAFFRYYNHTDFDLRPYGIYKTKWELFDEVDKICLVKALRMGGLNDEKYTMLKTMVKDANIPMTQIHKICDTLQIKITVKRFVENKNQTIKSIYGKNCDDEYLVGLLDKHYFIINETPYRHLIENMYPSNNWSNSVKKDAKIDSFNLIRLLLNDKKYLIQIPYQDLENTAFYKMIDDDILTLEYDEKCCDPITNTFPEPKKSKNVFFDFETYTDENNNHIPYLCCICYELFDKTLRQKCFIGNDCGKQMLLYLNKAFAKEKDLAIQLIAHNATYDYQFLAKYFINFTEVKRGNKMLSAKGKYFGRLYKIKCSYHLISTKLEAFGQMFKLKQEKEIMPYSLYNEINDIFNNRVYPISKVINGYNKHGHRFLKEKDVQGFIHNIEKWGLNQNGYFDVIEYSRKYCEMDCIVLMNGYNTFRSWILELTYINTDGSDSGRSLELDIDYIMTSASLAHKYMLKNYCYSGLYHLGGIPQQFIQKCVVGGRTMSNSNQQYNREGKIGDFDGVSLYPSAMKRMTGWLKGLPKVIRNCCYENVKTYDGYFVEVLIKNVPIHRQFPLLSYKNKEGIRDFTNDMIGKSVYLDKIMLEDLMTFQGLTADDFEIIRGYYFDEGFNTKINKTIEYLFETRKKKKAQGNPIEQIYKLIMNSAYGKSILKEQTTETKYFHNRDEYQVYLDRNYDKIISVIDIHDKMIKVETIASIHSHQNIAQVGVSVLSWSKRIMNEVMCLAEDNNIFLFYQDTDSMHMYQDDINILADLFKKKYVRELIGEELGQFHSDFEIKYNYNGEKKKAKDVYSSHLIVLGKKCYVDRLVGKDCDGNEVVDYHIRLKGVPNSTIEYEIEKQEIGDVINLYEKMYSGECINFDLTEGMGKMRCEVQKGFGVKTVTDFKRKICFKKSKK